MKGPGCSFRDRLFQGLSISQFCFLPCELHSQAPRESLAEPSSQPHSIMWLLLDPFSVTGTKGDSGTPSGTFLPQNLPHHHFTLLQPFCVGTGHPGVEFQTGGGAQALSAFIFLLKLPGMSVFVLYASLGGDLAQRWPQALQGTWHILPRLSLQPLSSSSLFPESSYAPPILEEVSTPSSLWTLGSECTHPAP